MKISTKRVGTVDVLIPHGALVDDDADSFIQSVQTRLKAPNPRFVLDLHDVPYMDSAGLEALVDAASDLQKRGGRLRLAAVSPTCREVFDLTGHSQQIEFFNAVQDAVRSFL
jgi:anti-anti-sigma factor